MREHLVGYLLNALEPAEHESVQLQLTRDPQLRSELERISRCLSPLEADRHVEDCPQGLADRTCQFVAAQVQTTLRPAPTQSRWRMADIVVAAGIFLAATVLFFPALNQSRFASRLAGCQYNLGQIGGALGNYAMAHGGYYPDVPPEGKLSAAGIYARRLLDDGYLSDHTMLVCPASALCEKMSEFRVPTTEELHQCTKEELAKWHARMGGSYGYNLGYIVNGRLQAPKDMHRTTFAILADAPGGKAPFYSRNHDGKGQNVLFEDGHVRYLTTCTAQGCTDDIFVNDDGEVASGLHMNDAVIGPSHARPANRARLIQIFTAPTK